MPADDRWDLTRRLKGQSISIVNDPSDDDVSSIT